MKRKGVIVALSMVIGFSTLAFAASSLAWFRTGTHITFGHDTNNVNVIGGSGGSYYKSGNGTVDDKYVISDKIHLYNLAWLQYIGYYNHQTKWKILDPSADIIQSYFVLENDIDMGGLTIPPIGTNKYPFLGNFDGCGHTVSNFTISNDNPALSGSDFGVAKPVNLYEGAQPDVVGFFGVVGKLPNTNITYDSSFVSVSNVSLSNFTVKAKTNQVLIGLAAGYVDGAMSGVKVKGNSTIDVGNQSRTAKTDITDKLSDYGLVGYSKELGSSGTYEQELSAFYTNYDDSGSGGQGTNVGEGGSIQAKEYSDWFFKMHYDGAYDTNGGRLSSSGISFVNTRAPSTDGKEEYKAAISFVNSPSLPTIVPENIYVKIAQVSYTVRNNFEIYRENDSNGRTGVLKVNNTYYNFTWDANNSGLRNSADPENFTITFTGGSARLGGSNRTMIYLNHYSANKGANYRMYTSASGSGTTNLIKVAASGVIENSGNNNGNFSFTDNRVYRTLDSYTESEKNYLYHLKDTNYLPLKFTDENRNATSAGNTGYIVGSTLSNGTAGSPKLGTTSNYTISAISNSLGGSTYTESKFEVLTYAKHEGSWDWYGIEDSHNKNGTNTNLSSYTRVSAKDLGLHKYEYYEGLDGATSTDVLARDSLHTTLSNSTYLYGLHFDEKKVDQSLTASNYLSIPYAKVSAWDDKSTTNVNEGLIQNLSVPKGAIDFHFGSTGYINFFAGSYVKVNGSTIDTNFFSIYKIARNANTKAITAVYEILEVYDNEADSEYTVSDGALDKTKLPSETNMKYAFKVSDAGGNVSYLPSGFSGVEDKSDRLLFDVNASLYCGGVNEACPVENAIYYFEIPVNVGEYCMGMVSNTTESSSNLQGAYLLYLDIAANSDVAESDGFSAYYINTIQTGNSYPLGVDFSVVGASTAGGDSFCVYLDSGLSGTVSFAVNETGSQVAVSGSTRVVDANTYSISTFTFKGSKYSDTAVANKFIVNGSAPPGQMAEPSEGGQRILTINLATTSGANYVLRVTDSLDDDRNITNTVAEINSGSGFVNFDLANLSGLSSAINLNDLRALSVAVVLERQDGSTNDFITTYDLVNCKSSTNTVAVDIERNGTTIDITVNSPYLFYISGDQYLDGETYPRS